MRDSPREQHVPSHTGGFSITLKYSSTPHYTGLSVAHLFAHARLGNYHGDPSSKHYFHRRATIQEESLPPPNVRPAKTQAGFIQPMLLLPAGSLPEGDEWVYELKLDGYRAIAFKTDGQRHLRARNDKDFNEKCPAITLALSALPNETVIDGEVVALDDSGRPSFNLLQKLWFWWGASFLLRVRPARSVRSRPDGRAVAEAS